MMKIPRTVVSQHKNPTLTGEHTLITWWQDITPHTTVFPHITQAKFKFKITHCHNNLLNRKIWLHIFHPTTQFSPDNTFFTQQHTANIWADSTKTKFRLRQPYRQTCWMNCRYCVSTTTPNFVNIIKTNHNEYTNLRRQKRRNWTVRKSFLNYAQDETRNVRSN